MLRGAQLAGFLSFISWLTRSGTPEGFSNRERNPALLTPCDPERQRSKGASDSAMASYRLNTLSPILGQDLS